MCVCVLSRSVVYDSLWPLYCSPPGSCVHGDSPGKNTGVDCPVLLQRIFPTRGWTHVFGIEHRFFTIWVTRENSISQNWNPYFQKIINRREYSQQTLDIHAHFVVNIERETLLKTGNGANWESMLSPCQHCTLSSRYCNKKNKISTGSKKNKQNSMYIQHDYT